jgi:alcohol dehydrogenase/L-iditol 2-dehydrogenase
MQAVVNVERKPYAVETREKPIPEIGPDDVLLRVRGVGVCGSDLHQWHADHPWHVNYPVVLGHEFGGEIAAVGSNVTTYKEGDRVVSETAAHICGACVYCRTGFYNLCPKRLGFGYGVDGAMAEYVRVPTRCLHRIPNGLPYEDAALTEPGCVAAQSVLELSQIQPGDFVIVLGPGPIGLMALQMAKLGSPGELWMAGLSKDANRLKLASQLGATRTLATDQEDLLDAALSVGDGFGAHLIIDCTGVSAALKPCLDIVRPQGQITKVGWGPQPMDFSLDPLVQKAARLQGSFSHNWKTWERVLGLYASGAVRPDAIRKVFPLSQWNEAFKAMDSLEIAKSVLVP